jgi:lysophospholipase L1-like esterase
MALIFLKIGQICICLFNVSIDVIESSLKKRISTHSFSLSGFVSGLLVLLIFTSEPENEMSYTILCLGDSYTIGESVLPTENFPRQTVQLLNHSGYNFKDPEIIAKTGWTTDELQTEINNQKLKLNYDFVTLLIGVNNQYRGKPVEDYEWEFESLLEQAIQLAGDKASHVIVLSIPDWGVTPFAKDRNRNQIAKQIDNYNEVNKNISLARHVNYIDITSSTRQADADASLLAADGLHPSGKEYAKWSEEIYLVIRQHLQ